ncbi:ribonuclease Z [Acidianus sulfidivorans JP7]|uniref:Ribonuclease Z n=1 Tax=Acidianus sulfidivorans JP7 TaxID=619593 RepID=A0A2U9INT4_9CREN|nr:ribonuclease Z [Acidianus sulfidivorans]AWR97673.1 ribonuclease Z [Acidianus sulfidivorans JP7]
MIKVFFIGTGGGAPSKRGLPAFLVRREAFNALLDCGEGTQITMIKNKLSIMSLKVIAITHLHADHVLGLPALIQTMNMYNRTEKLYIIGQNIDKLLKSTFEATYFSPNFEIEYVNEYKDNEISIKPFKTCHVIPSQGYIIEEKEKKNIDIEKLKKEGINDWRIIRQLKEDKEVHYNGKLLKPDDYIIKRKGIRIAYTGDTTICDNVIKSVKDVDLLLHDSTFLDDINAKEYGHSTASDAATVALEANVKRLALVHISGRYTDSSEIEETAKKIFSKSFVPEDLSYYVLS